MIFPLSEGKFAACCIWSSMQRTDLELEVATEAARKMAKSPAREEGLPAGAPAPAANVRLARAGTKGGPESVFVTALRDCAEEFSSEPIAEGA